MAVSDGALADACAVLAFYGAADGTMTPAGVAAMQSKVFISPITVWELSRKASLGKLPPLPTADGSFAGWLAAQGFSLLSLTWLDAERANALPPIHKDPMDRMLIAQALGAVLPVITDDGLYPGYGVATIW